MRFIRDDDIADFGTTWQSQELADGQLLIPLMFEGLAAGRRDLVVRFNDAAGNTLSNQSISLDLRDISAFYEHWSADPLATGVQTAHRVSPVELIAPSRGAERFGRNVFDNEYFMFVHGWNMTPPERLNFAETGYKRMWWSGYAGQYGVYTWPADDRTDASDDGLVGFLQAIADDRDDLDNFNRSEQTAYESAEGLRILLDSLRGDYDVDNPVTGSQINVMAHSLGTAVVSEALRREVTLEENPRQLVRNVILSQAAISADMFDASAPDQEGFHGFAPDNPDFFGTYPAAGQAYFGEIGQAVAGKVINYFNPDDYALDIWRLNQNLKHNPLITNYTFDGGASDHEPVFNTPDGLGSLPSSAGLEYLQSQASILSGGHTDRAYELIAYAVRSWSNALGVTGKSESGPEWWSERRIGEIETGFANRSHSHSGQFNGALVNANVLGERSDVMKYWQEYLLEDIS